MHWPWLPRVHSQITKQGRLVISFHTSSSLSDSELDPLDWAELLGRLTED